MDSYLLTKLNCPHCSKNYHLSSCFLKSGTKIIHGIITCQCNECPIVSGVLFMLRSRARKNALLFLKQYPKVASKLPNIPFFLFNLPGDSKIILFLIILISKLNILKYLSYPYLINFFSILGLMSKEEGKYFDIRQKSEIFLPTLISTKLINKNNTVLDAGCGSGHLITEAKKYTPEKNICAIDIGLHKIYLAKNYLSSKTNYIYYDLNLSLPFKDKVFNLVFCSDTFHYLPNQNLLSQEFKRLIKKQGLIILNHLHNNKFALYFNNNDEYSRSINNYLSLFKGLNFALFSEEYAKQGLLKLINKNNLLTEAKKLKTFTLIFYNKVDKKQITTDLKLKN